jgi:hypothetical protein
MVISEGSNTIIKIKVYMYIDACSNVVKEFFCTLNEAKVIPRHSGIFLHVEVAVLS